MEKRLHIVCLDTPYPVDCKSAFIMFHEIKALYEKGVKITLHCFEYSRPGNDILNQYCDRVYYYPKQKGHKGLSFSLPYIVSSRSNEQLGKNLEADDYPVFVHGVHSTFFLNRLATTGRRIVVRLHCAEHSYCNSLVNIESSFLNKIYYQHESRLLKCYEKNLSSKAVFATLTEETKNNYQQQLGYDNIISIPVIIPWNKIEGKEGKGNFCLYHGNLSTPENEKSAIWLLENVFNKINIPFVIAGKSPSSSLENLALLRANSCLIANPSENEMQDLIRKAHINVLPSFHAESCNIKLLNSLFCGRHCVVNEKMATDPELKPLLHVAENAESFRSIILQLMNESFEEYDIKSRERLLSKHYNNEENVSTLINQLW
ncbi:MAG: glycosyltransferase [Chitinophagaceae bacterium]